MRQSAMMRGLMRIAIAAAQLAALACVVGCGGSDARPQAKHTSPAAQRPPVPACSLLTTREVTAVLRVRARVHASPSFCTYQGTHDHVFRSVVVTPQDLAAAPAVTFDRRYGPITPIVGRGYRGEAQDDPVPQNGATVNQAKAQVTSGDVIVRMLVTYNAQSLRRVSQVPVVATLARRVGRRLARTR
jgi:hypothetical protein